MIVTPTMSAARADADADGGNVLDETFQAEAYFESLIDAAEKQTAASAASVSSSLSMRYSYESEFDTDAAPALKKSTETSESTAAAKAPSAAMVNLDGGVQIPLEMLHMKSSDARGKRDASDSRTCELLLVHHDDSIETDRPLTDEEARRFATQRLGPRPKYTINRLAVHRLRAEHAEAEAKKRFLMKALSDARESLSVIPMKRVFVMQSPNAWMIGNAHSNCEGNERLLGHVLLKVATVSFAPREPPRTQMTETVIENHSLSYHTEMMAQAFPYHMRRDPDAGDQIHAMIDMYRAYITSVFFKRQREALKSIPTFQYVHSMQYVPRLVCENEDCDRYLKEKLVAFDRGQRRCNCCGVVSTPPVYFKRVDQCDFEGDNDEYASDEEEEAEAAQRHRRKLLLCAAIGEVSTVFNRATREAEKKKRAIEVRAMEERERQARELSHHLMVAILNQRREVDYRLDQYLPLPPVSHDHHTRRRREEVLSNAKRMFERIYLAPLMSHDLTNLQHRHNAAAFCMLRALQAADDPQTPLEALPEFVGKGFAFITSERKNATMHHWDAPGTLPELEKAMDDFFHSRGESNPTRLARVQNMLHYVLAKLGMGTRDSRGKIQMSPHIVSCRKMVTAFWQHLDEVMRKPHVYPTTSEPARDAVYGTVRSSLEVAAAIVIHVLCTLASRTVHAVPESVDRLLNAPVCCRDHAESQWYTDMRALMEADKALGGVPFRRYWLEVVFGIDIRKLHRVLQGFPSMRVDYGRADIRPSSLAPLVSSSPVPSVTTSSAMAVSSSTTSLNTIHATLPTLKRGTKRSATSLHARRLAAKRKPMRALINRRDKQASSSTEPEATASRKRARAEPVMATVVVASVVSSN